MNITPVMSFQNLPHGHKRTGRFALPATFGDRYVSQHQPVNSIQALRFGADEAYGWDQFVGDVRNLPNSSDPQFHVPDDSILVVAGPIWERILDFIKQGQIRPGLVHIEKGEHTDEDMAFAKRVLKIHFSRKADTMDEVTKYWERVDSGSIPLPRNFVDMYMLSELKGQSMGLKLRLTPPDPRVIIDMAVIDNKNLKLTFSSDLVTVEYLDSPGKRVYVYFAPAPELQDQLKEVLDVLKKPFQDEIDREMALYQEND